MTIRTFRAPTVGEALAQVKKELGAGAVILHTRTYKIGGVLGVGARTVTEITATTELHVTPRPAPAAANPSRPRAQVSTGKPEGAGLVRAPGPDTLPGGPARAAAQPAGLRSAPPYAPPRPPLVVPAAAGQPARAPTLEPAAPRPDELFRSQDSSLALQIREEMAMLRKVVARMAVSAGSASGSGGHGSRTAGSAPAAMPDALASCYLRLIEAEVASEIADDIVNAVREQLTSAQLADQEIVRRAVLARLTRFVPASNESQPAIAAAAAPPRPRDGRPFTIALVGPTGVGKTTTIAKLAATYKLRLGLRVGLVTADTYRIAAVEQLRTYAGIIGLPLKVALTPAETRAACESLRDCDVVLLDTAGRAPSDRGRLGELGAFLDAALPHETHLVLSSAASEACMRQAAQAFSAVGPTHLIFTKLDEAVSFGALVNIVRHVNAKLSFVTTGQEVPDHIEIANAPRLAGLILERDAGAAVAPVAEKVGRAVR